MNLIKRRIFLSLFLFGLALFSVEVARAEEIQAPIILETAEIKNSTGSQIMIKGLVAGESQVLIYLNGQYKGLANISQGNNKFSHFNFLSSPLKDITNFEVFAIAQDKLSHVLSAPAKEIVSTIIEENLSAPKKQPETIKQATSLPPPVLLSPNQKFCESKPYISGTAQNRSLVKIFINNKLYDKFFIYNKSSSTAFFCYTPSINMERGQYSVYATVEDEDGNKSPKSNILSFCISDPQIISTSSIDVQENELAPTSSTPELDQEFNTNNSQVFQKTSENKQNIEEKSNKINSKFNILLFIGFIIAIIVWIFVVNKELLEENKETTSKKQ